MKSLRIAIAQINTIVGDLKGNKDKIAFFIIKAREKHSDIVIFPELSITGYPPEDLLLKPHFIKENIKYLKDITAFTKDIIAIVGFVDKDKKDIYNSAAILVNKKLVYVYNKKHLPNYGVFDEKRYFNSGTKDIVLKAKDFSFSLNICEDMWCSKNVQSKYANFLINISASPYCLDKIKERESVLVKNATRFKIPICYCNLVGGQDELIFDGRSFAVDGKGKFIAKAKAFEEDLVIIDLPINSKKTINKNKKIVNANLNYEIKEKKKSLPKRKITKDLNKIEEIYSALVLGVHDYVKKNNFSKVSFGLSGGIDSALVASIAVNALGRANALAISMPSRYSSEATQDDSEKIARNLGIRFAKVPIDGILDAYINVLGPHFRGMKSDITEENIQARIRGNILMAFSNKFGYLILNTGNKSETSVGYCTLYGDMAGGFAVIKDIPKEFVYKLANFVNKKEHREIIPKNVFKRAPSAELKANQKDQDMLPPYELLDEIIDLYIEKNSSFKDIVKKSGNKDIVKKVLKMVDINEYKRRQAPPGIKITPRAFGKDRRMPITNKFMEVGYEKDSNK